MLSFTHGHGGAGQRIRWLVLAGLVGGLAACGGGGGGSSSSGAATIDITAANRDTISHAVAGGILAFSSTGAIQVDITAAPADRKSALAGGVGQRSAWSGRLIALLTAGWPQEQRRILAVAQAVTGPVEQSCAFSGSFSVTFDDRDDSGTASVGDVLTLAFNDCQDTAGETVNGSAAATYLAVDTSQPSVSARLVATQLSDTTATHALTLNGTLRLDFSMPNPTSDQETITLTAEGPVVASVSTHLPFDDTVTLQKGWTETETYDGSVAPVGGNVSGGRTTLSVTGNVESNRAGGIVRVSTASALTSYGEDSNPRSGAVRVEGRTGTLQLTALSTDAVRIDLDADDNGSWESTQTQTWDWLM